MSYTVHTYAPGSTDTVSKIMFTLKTQLLLAGWTCVMSSDGDTLRAAHDVITSVTEVYKPDAPSGPGDSFGIQAPYTTNSGGTIHNPGSIDNPGAWFVLEQPGVKARQICIQRTTTRQFGYDASAAPGFRVKYSLGGLFDFASSTSTRTPHASDELVLTSTSDSDAAPHFEAIFGSKNDNSAVHIVTGGAAEDYPFVIATFANAAASNPSGASVTMQGGSRIQSLFFLDIARTLPDGSVDPLDPDPAVIGLDDAQVAGREDFVTFYVGTPYAALGSPVQYAQVNGTRVGDLLPAGMTYDGNPIIVSPVPWARGGTGVTSPKGFKGYSTLFYFSAVFVAPMTLFTVDATSRMQIGYASIPWDGTTPINPPTPASYAAAFVSPFTPPADALEDFDPNPDALSVDAGLDSGRITPRASDIGLPSEGTHVVCLGHDRPGFRGWLNAGDFVEVSQAANFGSHNAVTFAPRLRPPANTPGGYAWKASVLIDGIEQSHRLFHGRGVEDLSTWTLNVSKLSTIDHRLSFRLTLIATG